MMDGQTLEVNGIEYHFSPRQLKYRQLFQNDLYLCTKYLCGFHEGAVIEGKISYPMNWYLHGSILHKMQYEKWTRLLLELPRGAFKSSMIVGYCIWKIINNPNTSIGMTGGNMSLCKAFLQQQEDVIMSPTFRSLFPEIPPIYSPNSPLSDWSKTQYTVNRTTTSIKEPTVYLFTQKSKIEGWHFSGGIVADDIVNRDNYKTEVKRNGVKEFVDDFTNLVENINTPILYIGTPWHPDDVYALLKERPHVTKCIIPLYDRDGNVFFSEKFTPEYVKQIRDDLNREGGGDKMFTTQYLLEAVSEENAPLSQYDYPIYHEEEITEEDGTKVIARVTEDGRIFKTHIIGSVIMMDTSGSGVDTCGIMVLLRDNDDNWFVRYAKEGRGWVPSRRFKEIVDLDKQFNVKHIGVEVFGQITTADLIGEDRIAEWDNGYKFVEVKHHQKAKDERIMNYTEPKLQAKKIFWYIGVPEPAIKQVKYYREMAQDTIPDTLAYGIQLFEEKNIKPVREQPRTIGGWKPHRPELFKGLRG